MKKVSEIFKEISDKRLKEDLSSNSGLFFVKYSGVSSAALTQLRRDLKNVGARMFVAKNSFTNVALKSLNIGKEVSEFINGPTALVFVKSDPVAPSKVLTDFAKNNETIKLAGGYIHDRVVQSKDFKVLASIPPIKELYRQIAVAFNAPLTKFALSLKQITSKLAYALNALSDKKQQEKK